MTQPFVLPDDSVLHAARPCHELEQALRSESFIQVHRRVLRQLIETLIYEDVIQPRRKEVDGSVHFQLDGCDAEGHALHYRFSGRRRVSFDRIRLDAAPVMRYARDAVSEVDSLAGFMMEIDFPVDVEPERLMQFTHELERTLFNDSLAQHARRHRPTALRALEFDAVESLLADGHPYHPCYKSRIGFDALDNFAFGHEFGSFLQPLWLAARHDRLRVKGFEGADFSAFIAEELGETVVERFYERIEQQGVRPDDYYFLPVHPWQWREQVVHTLFQDIRRKDILVLGQAEDRYRAQQSIRTLANDSRPDRCYLKLSMGILNTSTSRILAPHTVQNAPAISAWLQSLLEQDDFLREELRPVFLAEVHGAVYLPAGPEVARQKAYGMLACIWRESLHPHLNVEEAAVPFNALTHIDDDGKPFIEPWVQAHGLLAWLRCLLEASVLPVLHILYAHGIALESHAQNMMLIHRQGMPARVALKDFHDGIRFVRECLSDPENRPELLATPEEHARVNRNSYIVTDDPVELRDFVHDAFLFINMSELALLLSEHFNFDEDAFWTLLAEVLCEYQDRFPTLQSRFSLFDFFAPEVRVEQLTLRRLLPDTEVRMHRVANPLAGKKRGDRARSRPAC
ncbi:siderophore synthetase component [Nitrospina gracilis]|nr:MULTISPECIES: IucA/IucC family protein [Nitrospina]MCF8723604.1 siderophore synthetase component [Nitrospina sp. Nb-3]